jgi:hypothetical protein
MFLRLLALLPKVTLLQCLQGNRFKPMNFDSLTSTFSSFLDSAVEYKVHSVKELVRL